MNELTESIETIPYENRIFVNRSLRMEHITAIGFDMDYTLAIYKEAAEFLTWKLALDRLVNTYDYPKSALNLKYKPDFSIRGLVLDTQRGNILKLDSHKFVQRVIHGFRPLSHDDIREEYRNILLRFAGKRFVVVDSLFERPEVYMYASLIKMLENERGKKLRMDEYKRLFRAIRDSVDSVHADGSLKIKLVEDLDTYFHKDPGLAPTLHKLRSTGKKLFLLTNSEWWFVNRVMTFLLNDCHPDYRNWRQFFDLLIVKSGKPDFFSTRTPFMQVDTETGEPVSIAQDALVRENVYQGGNIHDLEEWWNHSGDSILYVGDNIFSDIVRSKKRTTWRTAMIIPELEDELSRTRHVADRIQLISKEEDLLRDLHLRMKALHLRMKKGEEIHHEAEEAKEDVHSLEKEMARQEQAVLRSFNPLFGMLFKERHEHSLFGAQMEDYACVYTSRVANFRLYSPMEYFRSPRDFLPHELHLFR